MRPEAAAVAVPTTVSGRNMAGEHFDMTAGWGHYGEKDAVMPGQGRTVERPYTYDERAAIGDTLSALGDTTFDVYLNDAAYWCNVPAAAWNYRMGGYQVLKKWLSYRERAILGRSLCLEEVQYFSNMTRKIGDWSFCFTNC